MWNIDSFSIFYLKYFAFFVTYDTNEECLGFELLIRQKKGSLNALEYKYCFDNFSI